ncbi:GldG family protein [Gracilibacillus sp. YIM 98692]|uniref:GldG family protein n=1 Tax=Gracilibacillus sp. YIM 98692 TaxID=2663532 RepID=UPI001F093008|nr:GldG family protein [Gracilibacillus sp. YIM 98692]
MFKKWSYLLIAFLCFIAVFVPTVDAEGPLDPAPEISPNGSSNGLSVLFDNTHGQTAGAADWVIDGAFSDFAEAIAEEGYYVKELRKEGRFTLSDLSDYDVFVIPEANIPFSNQEQQAMLDYVDQGGSIFFIADHYNADRNKNRWDSSEAFNGYRRGAWEDPTLGMSQEEADSLYMDDVSNSDWLSDNFGMRIRYNALGDVYSDVIVSPSQSFNITNNVSTMTMHAGSTIAITDPNKAKGIVYIEETNDSWAYAVDQGVYNGGGIEEGPYVAISKSSLGKVAVIGDSSPVEDITPKYKREETGGTKRTYDGFYDQDNHILLINLIDWLANQENYSSFDEVSGFELDQETSLLSMEDPVSSTEPEEEPWSDPAAGYKWWDRSTFKEGSYGYEESNDSDDPVDGLIENFDSGSKGAYAADDVMLESGSWYFDNALLGSLSSDKKNGTQSARIRSNGIISMNFDVNGAESVTLEHANFGSDSGANWSLEKSTDGGTTWTSVAGPYSSGSALASETILVNETNSVRFRIVVGGTSGERINIDDVNITEPSTFSFENFDSGSKGAYAADDVTLESGSWYFDNALLGSLSSDKKNGTQSARIRSNGIISMNFDVNEAESITLEHANFGSDSGANWSLEKSTDGGTTWTSVAGPYSSGSALASETIQVNETNTVRFRIVVGGTSGERINIDDFHIIH